jgi:hypothetical protein
MILEAQHVFKLAPSSKLPNNAFAFNVHPTMHGGDHAAWFVSNTKFGEQKTMLKRALTVLVACGVLTSIALATVSADTHHRHRRRHYRHHRIHH